MSGEQKRSERVQGGPQRKEKSASVYLRGILFIQLVRLRAGQEIHATHVLFIFPVCKPGLIL